MIGDSKEQIEQCLNCTKPECTNCLRTSERRPSFIELNKDELRRLCEYDLSDGQIARLLGCGKTTVRYNRHKLGIPCQKERQGGRWKEMMSNAICPEKASADCG